MLELRPNCELCDRDLPPADPDARICSYECTYCMHCAENVLEYVCPTCGGNFVPRPIRPASAWRSEFRLGLANHPASSQRRHSRWSPEEIQTFVQRMKGIDPKDR